MKRSPIETPASTAGQRATTAPATGRPDAVAPVVPHARGDLRSAQAILVMQRQVGNTAVAAMLQRKPTKPDIVVPELGIVESIGATVRAEQFAALPEAERRAIDDEADRRYREQRGVPAGAKPATSAERELWKRTRDEVLRDRNRLDSLPNAVRAYVMPGDRRPTADQYRAGLRVGSKLEAFSWEDWGLFQRRAGAPKGDLPALEGSVDRFVVERARERKVIERVRGTEALYQSVFEFRVAQSMGMKPKQYRLWPKYDLMNQQLKAAGFASVPEYEVACSAYLEFFRARAVEITQLALDGSEKNTRAELARHSNTSAPGGLFDQLATLRRYVAEYHHETGAGSRAPSRPLADVTAERDRLAKVYPVLADPDLDIRDLSADTPAALGGLLRNIINKRLSHIAQTRERVIDKPDKVLELNRVVSLTMHELDVEPGSIGQRIVQARVEKMQRDDAFWSEALIFLSVGLGMLTFGVGTGIAALVGAGSVAVGAYQAHDEWKKYEAASAASRTDFDRAKSVSSQEPSAVWLAISIIGLGFDAVSLGSTLRALRPALQALDSTGSVAAFSAKLAAVPKLTPGQINTLNKAADAWQDFLAAWRRAKLKVSRPYGNIPGGVDPTLLHEIALMAYAAARVGIRNFEIFLEVLKAQRVALQGIDVNALAPGQLKAWKAAFWQGVKEFDAKRPVITVPGRKGTKTITLGDDVLIDGKVPGAKRREDTYKQLGLTHTVTGHGAAHDAHTIAQQALQNARNTPRGAGSASQWASDRAMMEAYAKARVELAANRATPVPGSRLRRVEFPIEYPRAIPEVGRVFTANSHVPTGARIVDRTPFANLAVTELAPTHVHALFDPRGELSSIYLVSIP